MQHHGTGSFTMEEDGQDWTEPILPSPNQLTWPLLLSVDPINLSLSINLPLSFDKSTPLETLGQSRCKFTRTLADPSIVVRVVDDRLLQVPYTREPLEI